MASSASDVPGRRRRRAGPAEPVPGQADDPQDPKRISINLRLVRRELFDELVADREAFDALPLEEKQKVFALIEQRMAGVEQGINVLQKELASRAAEVRTQDAAAQPRRPRPRRPWPRRHDGSSPPAAPAPAPPPPPSRTAGPPASRPRRPRRRRQPRCRARDETIDAAVGQAARGQGRARRPGRRTGERRDQPAEPARDGLREDAPRPRRGAVRRRRRRRALHARRRRRSSSSRRCARRALSADSAAGHDRAAATGSSRPRPIRPGRA